MADINKSALLVLNDDKTKFLVDRKTRDGILSQWLMPGGKIEHGETLEQALVREIKEEINCELDIESVKFIAEYEAPASGMPGKTVNIKLYSGTFTGTPVASSEITAIGWLGREDLENPEASETIRVHILPDLLKRGIIV
ncbi:MAG: NUDIX domain-containing protein [Patescibacteria group bacterium]|jgi:mutator protein MutT